MGRKAMWAAAAAVVIALPAPVSAQAQSIQQVGATNLETLKTKFHDLGEAIPEDKWDWRPMEGTRSVREVLALAIAEAHLFPTMWGYDAPAVAAQGFQPEMDRTAALSRRDMLAQIHSSFDHMIEVVEGMDREKRMTEMNFFGQTVQTQTAVWMAMTDMHEHLGQLIAYARSNEVVPPWSRSNME